MSKRIINILENYEDFELAFLREYKINTYLPDTKKEILEYLEKRGITIEKSYLLINKIKSKQFSDDNYRCPRCKSKRIKKETIELTNLTSQTSALDGLIGKSEFGERKICEICGLWINDPNGEKPQKMNFWKRFFNINVIIFLLTALLFSNCSNSNLTELSEYRNQNTKLELTNDSLNKIIIDFKNNKSKDLIGLGLKNPKIDIFNSLQKRTDLFPIKGELGTKMHFGNIEIINNNWIIAEFDDGHSMGSGIYEFIVRNDTTIDFKLLDWKYDN